MEETRKISNAKFIFLIIILSLILIVLYARLLGTKGLVVKETALKSNLIKENYNGFKIVQFSDLLYGRTVNENDVKKLVSKINELKPDIVIFTGDLIDKDTIIKESLNNFLSEELGQIDANIAKYAISGDYDYKNSNYEITFKNAGFKILNNTYDLIYYNDSTPIMIAGLDSLLKGNEDINSAFSYINEHKDEEYYKIAIAHEGDYFNKIKDYNINLFLCGHSLNGQIRIPYVGAITSTKGSLKYYNPYYKEKDTDIYVSSGIGTTNYSFRWFNRPSINFFRLYNKG